MANQCCCKKGDYNVIDNCIGCDTGSLTNYTAIATVTGFTDVYACSIATHVNRTLAHNFGSIGATRPSECRHTLIAGNASPPESYCQSWCPIQSVHQSPNLDLSTNCYPDADIGANEIPACVVSPTGQWECRCRDLCDHVKIPPRNSTHGYIAPTCYLTIWYTIHFRYNASSPSSSTVEYIISFFLADTYMLATSQSQPCDDGQGRGGFPGLTPVSFSGKERYNADQLCTAISIDIPLCPSAGCDWEKPDIPNGVSPNNLNFEYLCGYPLDFSSANVNITVSLS
jgi:hypothetical protein